MFPPADGSKAFFSAFAPPEITADEQPFLLEVTAFALEYGVEVAERAAAQGMLEASTRQRPLSIAHGEQVSIRLDLPSDAFETEQEEEVLAWEGAMR